MNNNWKVVAKRIGLRPLVADAERILCYYKGNLCWAGYDLKDLNMICQIPSKGLVGWLAKRFRMVDRIFRRSPVHAIILNGFAYVSRRSEIWKCNLTTGEIIFDFTIPNNRRALDFGLIGNSNGVVEIIFGEYFANPLCLPVRIWGCSGLQGKWSIKGEIASGEIEHIHAITKIDNNILILCGDFGESSGIWIATDDFSSITPLIRGSQNYRAAWLAKIDERILYATDTQLEQNYYM